MNPENDFMNVEEACFYLKIAKATLYKMSSERRVRKYKIGRRIVFLRTDLQALILESVVEPIITRKSNRNSVRGEEGVE